MRPPSCRRTARRRACTITPAGRRAAGLRVVIAGAGGAAHLPGMAASMTALPVLGVPVESHALKGMDSLLSIAQMPAGVPVGTLAIGRAGAVNAALLAAAILALSDPRLAARLACLAARPRRSPCRCRRDEHDPDAQPPPAARNRCRPAPPSGSSAAGSSAACRPWPRRGSAIAATSSRRTPTAPACRSPPRPPSRAYEDGEAPPPFRRGGGCRHLRIRERAGGNAGGARAARAVPAWGRGAAGLPGPAAGEGVPGPRRRACRALARGAVPERAAARRSPPSACRRC